MITTTADVQEVCVIEGYRAMERSEVEDKGKRENKQASANRVKKNIYFPPPFSLGQICEKGFLNLVTIHSFSYQIMQLYVIC